jgi:hypothetical protein
MEVHNLEGATASQVEQHHAADVAQQGKYGVEYLKYWFNESKGKEFCLVDAPSAEAAQLVHLDGTRPDSGTTDRSPARAD